MCRFEARPAEQSFMLIMMLWPTRSLSSDSILNQLIRVLVIFFCIIRHLWLYEYIIKQR